MTQQSVDSQNVDALLSAIVSQEVEVHLVMHAGKLAISGRMSINETSMLMDVSSIPEHLLDFLRSPQDISAIAFLNGEKLSWSSPTGKTTTATQESGHGETRILSVAKPESIIKTCGRKAARKTVIPHAIKIRIEGSEETFDLIDLSAGGCSFAAPSHAAKIWQDHAALDFEAWSEHRTLLNKLRIVRVSFDMENDSGLETIVSCRFESEDAGTHLLDG